MSNKPKHTPGPWKIRKSIIYANRVGAKTPGEMFVANVDSDFASFGYLEEFKAERRANADLIAAAPDMLEALERLAEALPEIIDPNNDEPLSGADVIDIISQNSRLIRDAIKKARGEA